MRAADFHYIQRTKSMSTFLAVMDDDDDATGRERENKCGLKREQEKAVSVFGLNSIHKKMCVAQIYMGFFPSLIRASFIPGLLPLRGGVTGRLFDIVGIFDFFSDGFKI